MPDLGTSLLLLARSAIAERLGQPGDAFSGPSALEQDGACFVTLTHNNHLRGCIGSLEAHRPLREDVRENARAAAFRDPRFAPLSLAEWPSIRIEVSLLGAAESLSPSDESELRTTLRPGIDGVILSAGGRRATFLPQVWEQLPRVADFLARLREKAGLPADYWGPDLRIERYQVQKWREPPP